MGTEDRNPEKILQEAVEILDPANAKGRELTVMEVLNAAAANVAGRFKDAPLVEAAVRDTLGGTYYSLGKYDAAEPHLRRAMEMRRDQLGQRHPATLTSVGRLAELYASQGRYVEAEQLYARTRETRRRVLGGRRHLDHRSFGRGGLFWRVRG